MGEALSVRIDDEESSTTSAPTTEGDGIQILRGYGNGRVHLQIRQAATGTATARVKVYGYISKLLDKYSLEPIDSDTLDVDAWYEIFDTGELSNSGAFNRSWLLWGATDYSRLATQILTNGGTSPSLTTALAFS